MSLAARLLREDIGEPPLETVWLAYHLLLLQLPFYEQLQLAKELLPKPTIVPY